MEKITQKQRVELMQNGFKKVGSIMNGTLEKLNIDRYDYEKVFIRMQNESKNEYAMKRLENEKNVYIDKVRSKDFIDSNGVYYNLKGNTFIQDNLMIHDYEDNGGKYSYAMHVYLLVEK